MEELPNGVRACSADSDRRRDGLGGIYPLKEDGMRYTICALMLLTTPAWAYCPSSGVGCNDYEITIRPNRMQQEYLQQQMNLQRQQEWDRVNRPQIQPPLGGSLNRFRGLGHGILGDE
jgi:hypothetical protein